jgi:hypothetical protein
MSTGDFPYTMADTWMGTSATASSSYTWGYAANTNINAVDTGVDELKAKVKELESLFFRKVVSKCPACGQWGAAMCECKHCGHPIDMGEMPDERLKSVNEFRREILSTKNMVGETGVQGELGLTGETGIQGCGNDGEMDSLI